VSGIGSSVLAQAPYCEFVCICWPLKNLGVIAVEATFRLKDRDAPIQEFDFVVVPFATAGETPFSDKLLAAQMLENGRHKRLLRRHRCGTLAAQPLDCSFKEA
jgi:hypothetical protein